MTTVGQTHQGHGRDARTSRLPAYEVRELQFSYELGTSASQSVIQNMSFSVESGEMLGIVGPNGSGKTSLLKLLANIASGQQGSIAIFGRPLSEMQQETVAKHLVKDKFHRPLRGIHAGRIRGNPDRRRKPGKR